MFSTSAVEVCIAQGMNSAFANQSSRFIVDLALPQTKYMDAGC